MNGNHELYDDFTDDKAAGMVIGSCSTSGYKRLGIDCEGVLSIDNCALRIAPLVEAGFGRAAIAYGPYPRKAGTAFAVYILNGRNSSQSEPLSDTFNVRIQRWWKGSETDSKWLRLLYWLRSGRVRRTFRQFRWWYRTSRKTKPVPLLDENLAVGWFPNEAVPDPRKEGSTFIMHALGPDNSQLWAGGPECRTKSLWGVQDLPLYLIAVIRTEGTIYYTASIEGARGFAPYPFIRPVAVDNSPLSDELYVGIQQSVLGQIGFRLDTRVDGVRVACLRGYENWWGGAHAAARIVNEENAEADLGGKWRVERSDSVFFTLNSGLPTGLLHGIASFGNEKTSKVGLVWRRIDRQNHWRLEVTINECKIALVKDGEYHIVAKRKIPELLNNKSFRMQILDNGCDLMAYIDGKPLTRGWITDERLEEAKGVGVFFSDSLSGGHRAIRNFEAHPRNVRLPDALNIGSPWIRTGNRVIVADDFEEESQDLEGHMTSVGGKRWKRIIGEGVIELPGDGVAGIKANTNKRCPGRTAYCVEWENPEFADLEVTITPPGTKRGKTHQSTAGFILFQDFDNYMILNIWRADYYRGASTSTFFKVDGFEDLYDAVWSNIGNRMYYGSSSRLRLCCDGERYLVFVNNEPILYRAFRDVYPNANRLRIHKIGLIANWEWGTDTGSKFEHFQARA